MTQSYRDEYGDRVSSPGNRLKSQGENERIYFHDEEEMMTSERKRILKREEEEKMSINMSECGVLKLKII